MVRLWQCVCFCRWCTIYGGTFKELHDFCEEEKWKDMVVNCRLYRENLSAKQTQEDPAAVFQDNVSIVPRQCIYCLNYTKIWPSVHTLISGFMRKDRSRTVGWFSIQTCHGYHEERCWRKWVSYPMKLALFWQNRIMNSSIVSARSRLLSWYS